MILYVTLHARKVTIEEWKQFETTRVTPSYKATIVLRCMSLVRSIIILNEAKHKTFYICGFHCETSTGLCIYPFATSILWTAVLYFRLPFLNPFPADKCHAWPRPLYDQNARTSIWPGKEAAETIWRTVNIVSMCQSTFNFLDSLVIFRHNFTGNGMVSCILATTSNWFPNKKI